MTASLQRQHHSIIRWFLWSLAGGLAVLLFVGGPGYHTPRSLSSVWDLGHVAAFSLWSFLLLQWKTIEKSSRFLQWRILLAFGLLFGGITEGFQSLIGGDASFGDLLRDMLGVLITLSWFAPASDNLSSGARRTVKSVSVSLLLIACIPLIVSVSDELLARARFPVLSDFETPFEKDRWEGGARFAIDRAIAHKGKASLRVEMDTSLYSGVSLVYFPRDWTGYRYLSMEIFNPMPDAFKITCRIHDGVHEKGEQRYDDRYNQVFHLLPGWNSLRIDLGDVLRAPVGRRMDIRNIRAVGVFSSRLPAPRTVFIDSVRLE